MSKRRKNRRKHIIQPQVQVHQPKKAEVAKITKATSTYNFCDTCKGECWKGKDNFATQSAAKKKFGILPNKCVISSTGKSLCPYA